MNLVTKLGLISVVTLMAACAPVEQKPLITAPTELEIIETKPITEEVVQTPVDAPVDAPVEEVITDNIDEAPLKEMAEEVVADAVEEVIATPIETAKQEAPPPAPLPDPYDPAILIGASPAKLQATLGRQDYSFDNSGMSIHHYRQDTCLLLVFINQADEITHIDLRHQLVNQTIDITACYQELGMRKDAVN